VSTIIKTATFKTLITTIGLSQILEKSQTEQLQLTKVMMSTKVWISGVMLIKEIYQISPKLEI
jgi:hypothetical protein